MLEAISEAIKTEQFEVAAQLLQKCQQDPQENPWIGFYEARVAEAQGDWSRAKEGYQKLLISVNNPKLISKIRQGLARLAQQIEDQQQQERLAQSLALEKVRAASPGQELGIFVLESIPPELKQPAAVKFAQIMQTDPYSARLQLPSRSWRLYRTGGIEELRFYVEKLQLANIPCFCVPLTQLLDFAIKPVFYLSKITPIVTAIYQVNKDEEAIFHFSWSEVSQRVEGLLPIFEKCVELDQKRKIVRKTKILDYARICDLHLPDRQIIIRLCDQSYEFKEGISLIPPHFQQEKESTSQEQWSYLMQTFREQMPNKPVWTDFNPFAENAIDFKELLKLIDPHIYFMRREESDWDRAFHLYSSLIFHKSLFP